MVLSRR